MAAEYATRYRLEWPMWEAFVDVMLMLDSGYREHIRETQEKEAAEARREQDRAARKAKNKSNW